MNPEQRYRARDGRARMIQGIYGPFGIIATIKDRPGIASPRCGKFSAEREDCHAVRVDGARPGEFLYWNPPRASLSAEQKMRMIAIHDHSNEPASSIITVKALYRGHVFGVNSIRVAPPQTNDLRAGIKAVIESHGMVKKAVAAAQDKIREVTLAVAKTDMMNTRD